MENQDIRALSGRAFDAGWPAYRHMKTRAHDLCRRYNRLDELDLRREGILRNLFAELGKDAYVRGPLQVNVGSHTQIGDRFFANFNLTILDDVSVRIGDDVQIGPNVTLIAGTHPLLVHERRNWAYPDGHVGGAEYADPVCIGDGVWIGANTLVMPGVSIGDRAVIGAGSLVTRDIPAGWLAMGSPCRPVREIGPEDSQMAVRQ